MSSLETGLSGKVVLVTGASSGIGRSAAVEFAKNGCRLAITGRNADNLKETSTVCQNEGKISEENVRFSKYGPFKHHVIHNFEKS